MSLCTRSRRPGPQTPIQARIVQFLSITVDVKFNVIIVPRLSDLSAVAHVVLLGYPFEPKSYMEAPMNVRPLHDRVLVKRVEEEQVSRGGIIIPDTAKEKPIRGLVVAVGNGRYTKDGSVRPLSVKADDVVLFSKYAGTEVRIDGGEHLIMREDDILGVIS